MAIQLNEEIRDEARKMSEYVVEDTKRTVEMLNWLKSKQQQDSSSLVTDALKMGAAVASGNVMEGAKLVIDNIMPRLRDRVSSIKDVFPDVHIQVKNAEALDAIAQVNAKVIELRSKIGDNEIDAHDFDDICYDIQVILSKISDLL